MTCTVQYETIYKRALSAIHDLDLARMAEEDFFGYLREWLHTTCSAPKVRRIFQTLSLDDTIMTLTFDMKNSVDEEYDCEFVVGIFAKGVIASYFPTKIDNSIELASIVGGKEEKKLQDHYSKKIERLQMLQSDFDREIMQHGYYFGKSN